MALLPSISSFAIRAAKSAEMRAAEHAAEHAAEDATIRAADRSFAVHRALPAPPKRLALPAPGPGLPPLASKPRGGQFYPDADLGPRAFNLSPEAAAREAALDLQISQWLPEAEGVAGRLEDTGTPASEWLQKALAKYYKTDFGSPDDPLRDLAARGLHYDPEMTPERWQQTVNDYLMEDPIGYFTVPRHESSVLAEHGAAPDDLAGQLGGMHFLGASDPVGQGTLMQAAPWLRKQPVTDNIYGIGQGGLDLSHFTDEMRNAMDVAASGLPADLAVRPESLQRMSFPQAVEHVGKINQYRAKEMERAALGAQNNPVTQMFKEYPDDPRGMRWVEMAPPKSEGPGNYDVEEELRKALKYEGDTMGHCVGGYCPDVMSGKSRIFSLRDAKGEPHVTIETSPAHSRSLSGNDINQWEPGAFNRFLDQRYDVGGIENMHEWAAANFPEKMSGENIVQIKGKQNRAPKDDYLPFVQDFVKSQQWGNVGDLRNTQLVKLPDGRYITNQQAEAGIAAIPGPRIYDPSYLAGIGPETWAKLAPYFQGYAIGGRVSADRCFTRHPMSVR